VRDGLLFLWCILDRTTAETNATLSTIVRRLNHLAELMSEHNSDVAVFNTQVRQLLNSYIANKRETFDPEVLLQNLFEAYHHAKTDPLYYMYSERSRSILLAPSSHPNLALKQYQTLVQKKVWGSESADHKESMNLSAQIVTLQKKLTTSNNRTTSTNKLAMAPRNGCRPKNIVSNDIYVVWYVKI
jgi:hypothetical protein